MPSVVLFDDACGTCSRWASFINRYDRSGNLHTLGQDSDEGTKLLSNRPEEMQDVDSVFIITEDGQWYAKSGAVWRIASKMGLPWSLGAAMYLVPYPIRDLFYDIYAKFR
tara:strand:- start:10798 stop:11127 length:330 start_codon:yes stop_codon:yes gene_type:complete